MTAESAQTANRLSTGKRVFVLAAPLQYFGQSLRRGGIAGLGQGVSRRGPQFRTFILEKWNQRRSDSRLRITSQSIDDRLPRRQILLIPQRREQRRDRLVAAIACPVISMAAGADFQGHSR